MSTDKPKRCDTRKGRRCNVDLTLKQFSKIQKMMEETGLSAQRLMKDALLARTDLESPVYSAAEAELFLAALKRIGQRVNKIAIQLNAGDLTDWNKRLTAVATDLLRFRMVVEGREPLECLNAL